MNFTLKRKHFVWIGLAIALIVTIAATIQPQLSIDEQNLIVDAVLQTLNPAQMAVDIAATVEANVLAKLGGSAAIVTNTVENAEAAAEIGNEEIGRASCRERV